MHESHLFEYSWSAYAWTCSFEYRLRRKCGGTECSAANEHTRTIWRRSNEIHHSNADPAWILGRFAQGIDAGSVDEVCPADVLVRGISSNAISSEGGIWFYVCPDCSAPGCVVQPAEPAHRKEGVCLLDICYSRVVAGGFSRLVGKSDVWWLSDPVWRPCILWWRYLRFASCVPASLYQSSWGAQYSEGENFVTFGWFLRVIHISVRAFYASIHSSIFRKAIHAPGQPDFKNL